MNSARTFWPYAPYAICRPHTPHKFYLLDCNPSPRDAFASAGLELLEPRLDCFFSTLVFSVYIQAFIGSS